MKSDLFLRLNNFNSKAIYLIKRFAGGNLINIEKKL